MRPRLLILLLACGTSMAATPPVLNWSELPSLPDRLGFAGSYAGISGGALIVAGGANFPDKPVWESGTKVWHDDIFVLERPDGAWRKCGQLPRAAGYGTSVTLPDGVLFIGGGDARENFRKVWKVSWNGKQVDFLAWPDLPLPLAMSAGALVGRTVYLAGGIDRPAVTSTRKIFLALDLDRVASGWRELEPWPGPDRAVATAGAREGVFFLFGGSSGGAKRVWLRDAYAYVHGQGWHPLAQLPWPVVAAPSPAPLAGGSCLLLLGGDDGHQADLPLATHRGFSRQVLAYDITADKWTVLAELPFSIVTTPLIQWDGRLIVPGGEARPGIRSAKIWSATFAP
ncbi:MAG: Galactose oxidase [Verrucomicrobia bacterium]|nr:Galactose oxidase [Verrucomicrobiota bacterium]